MLTESWRFSFVARPKDLAAPIEIITNKSLVFTRALLLGAARVKEELRFGFCHPGAYKLDRAEGANRKVCPGDCILSFSPATNVHPRAPEFKIQSCLLVA